MPKGHDTHDTRHSTKIYSHAKPKETDSSTLSNPRHRHHLANEESEYTEYRPQTSALAGNSVQQSRQTAPGSAAVPTTPIAIVEPLSVTVSAAASATQPAEARPGVNEAFDNLVAEMIKFPDSYEKRRKEMDGQRYFNPYRAETNTPARIAAAAFVKTMAELIQSKRSIIEIIESQDPSILVNALSGVLLVQLKKIDDFYKAKKSYRITQFVTQLVTSIKNSALASIIFDVLKVGSLDKIGTERFKTDLEALKKCLSIINAEKELESQDIVAFIGDIDQFLEPIRTAEPEAIPTTPAPAIS
ncbi:MAG: hypothetical protein A3F46_07670 [Legionellales bacterium RIFCSPHIGHO2_12_FULL_42_9]|nr:MAG: hypothetical protein A3F46_07670 [Legionellales bacterium RIFCSPHIGHO2_12_FULL_42_9]